jgi:pyoverdine/dityrosine biosynthesis protein Dit1
VREGKMDLRNKLNEISKILKEFSLQESVDGEENIPLLMRIKEKLEAQEELIFILPAFPAKSPSREKTIGELPDLGEVLALKNLQSFCNRIDLLHPHGTKVVICSDGRVFSDVVKVSDESIDRYNDGIITIIEEYKLNSLSVFTMDELYPDKTPDELREILLEFYAMELSQVRAMVIENMSYRSLFNGIHRCSHPILERRIL